VALKHSTEAVLHNHKTNHQTNQNLKQDTGQFIEQVIQINRLINYKAPTTMKGLTWHGFAGPHK